MSRKVAVLGGGSFGTAIANIAAENGYQVVQWMRSPEQAQEMAAARENRRYLPGCPLHENLQPVSELARIGGCELVFVAIPSASFRQVVRQARPHIARNALLVSTTKGIEGANFRLMSEVLHEELPEHPVGVLSGPNLAKEIGARQLAATVVASQHEPLCAAVQETLHCRYFRVYAGADVYGVELGGALKNIYAIAAGMSAALGMGENTRSMLMTRSLAEMSRFAVQMGANPLTFLGLAGVGDLIVTCSSPLSRNYRVGFMLGEGRDLDEAVDSLGEVAEGVNTLRVVKEEADKRDVYMPLVEGLYRVVFKREPVASVIQELMLGEQRQDVAFETGMVPG